MKTFDVDCFTSFFQKKGTAAVCGVVFLSGTEKYSYFETRPKGDYLNGLLTLLIERIADVATKLNGRAMNLRVHVHHKNSNFRKTLDKVVRSANAARGYHGDVLGRIIKHTLKTKDHHKPACYEKMAELVELLAKTNHPLHCITLLTCGDSQSPDQLAVYAACQGEWNELVETAA